jgi:hypothetical protein
MKMLKVIGEIPRNPAVFTDDVVFRSRRDKANNHANSVQHREGQGTEVSGQQIAISEASCYTLTAYTAYRRLNPRMRIVMEELKIFVLKIKNRLPLRIQFEHRERPRLTGKLLFNLF